MFSWICKTDKGYVLKVYTYYMDRDQWIELLNFGDNHVDALYFVDKIIPRLSEQQVIDLHRRYDVNHIQCGTMPADLELEYDIFS